MCSGVACFSSPKNAVQVLKNVSNRSNAAPCWSKILRCKYRICLSRVLKKDHSCKSKSKCVTERSMFRVFCSKRALKFEKEIKRTFPNPMIHAGYNNSHLLKPCFFSTRLKVDTILFKKTSPYIYISSSHQTFWKPPPERIPITSTNPNGIHPNRRRPSPGPTAMSSQSLAPAPTMRKRATCCPFFRMPNLEVSRKTQGPESWRPKTLPENYKRVI